MLEFVQVTEAAALAAARLMGRGDGEAVDRVAVEAMRGALAQLPIRGRVVIGEGERDEAPMLYIGEEVGAGTGYPVDMAVDPVEGTTLVARGQPNAISVIAASERGGILHAPDVYMEKLIVGPAAAGRVDLRWPTARNLSTIASSLRRSVQDITVVILDRPRHAGLIEQVREAGARIRLISDGDVSAAIAAALSGTGVHAVMGIGGAPEGVLAAAALRCLGGEIQGRFWFRNDEERERVRGMGVDDPDRVFLTEDLVPGREVVFSCTGITDGDLFKGVLFFAGGQRTHTLVMGARCGEIRFVDSVHVADRGRVGPIRLF
ncbi:MAG: class II fructose-bisphosphatase [Armatimonadota bacterium]|nr:class II fructose-bisphosphatase [Armatimonadota bacterium]MDR7389282.1 class II fructose-bisphosphatase [Armatimonadota bacterium]MDR7394251.1 class II fructose-bisphosphatase [Armatimonadota bacterium]MDR7406530.1 class II fructose-bisphosphatase [Armatimonadota bacterium]MDR7408901.1 class II fructose-bisphosphatase [Armatimonadota bacterium]